MPSEIPTMPTQRKIVSFVIARLYDVSVRPKSYLKPDREIKYLKISNYGYKSFGRSVRAYIQTFKPDASLTDSKISKQKTVSDLVTSVIESLSIEASGSRVNKLILEETGNA